MNGIMSYALNVSTQVAILFILIAVGAVLTKVKMLSEIGAKQITNLVLYFVTPAVIIKAFAGGEVKCTPDNIKMLAVAAVSAVLAHAVAFAIGRLVFRRRDKRDSMLACAVLMSNCGFMSLPLAQALLGDKGVFIVTVYVGVFNIVAWTVGLRIISGEKMSFKRAVLNPGVLSAVTGIIMFLCGVDLSPLTVVIESIKHLAALNTPLPMIVIGYYLAHMRLKPEKGDGRIMLAISLRLVAAPLITMAVLRAVGVTGLALSACVLPACAPAAVLVMMFAANCGGDAMGASRTVSVSHAASIITMPLMLMLCKLIGG